MSLFVYNPPLKRRQLPTTSTIHIQALSKQLLPRRRFLAVWIFDVVVLIPIAANKKYRKRCVTDRAIYYTFRFGNTLTDDVMWQLLNHVSCCKG